MEYKPRYYQPFTVQEAVHMDVSILTEEIARLKNSLEHLKRTQNALLEAAHLDPDPELRAAVKENEVVIGSQEERISILKMALTERGIFAGSHYDLPTISLPERAPLVDTSASARAQSLDNREQPQTPSQEGQPEENGVYL